MSKALVVDLDGTLYAINTFHAFLKFVLKIAIKRLYFMLFFSIFSVIVLRGFKLISHARMKYVVLKSIRNYNINYERFVNKISKYKRNLKILKDSKANFKILATAAPSCYAYIIAKNEKFDLCLGTDFPELGFKKDFENIQLNKKNSVLKAINDNNLNGVETVVTDHVDDFPLIQIADKTILVKPDSKLISKLKQNLISFEVIE